MGLSRSRGNRGRKATKIRGWERGLCNQPDANDKKGARTAHGRLEYTYKQGAPKEITTSFC